MCKKSLKIPKGQSEAVNQRRTDKTMVNRKKTKSTDNEIQNTTQKTNDWATQTQLKTEGELMCSGRASSSCSTSSRKSIKSRNLNLVKQRS